jgi:hypothetical protein
MSDLSDEILIRELTAPIRKLRKVEVLEPAAPQSEEPIDLRGVRCIAQYARPAILSQTVLH